MKKYKVEFEIKLNNGDLIPSYYLTQAESEAGAWANALEWCHKNLNEFNYIVMGDVEEQDK